MSVLNCYTGVLVGSSFQRDCLLPVLTLLLRIPEMAVSCYEMMVTIEPLDLCSLKGLF